MLEVLQFIFSSFWVFIGTLIILSAIGNCIVGVARAAVLVARSRRTCSGVRVLKEEPAWYGVNSPITVA